MLGVYILTIFVVGQVISNNDAGLVMSGWTDPGHLVTFPNIIAKGTIAERRLYIFSEYKAITGLASNPRQGDLFYYDGSLQRINRIQSFNIWMNNTFSFKSVMIGVSASLSKITFDWITNNIYWTDMLYNWIGMKPAYSSDMMSFKPLLYKNMDTPMGITLDATSGYLFWSDNGANPRIERATLAGEDRKTLVHKSLMYVTDLSVDTATKTLYWVDGSRNTLESINYDGQNRRVLTKTNQVRLISLDFYKEKIYISSNSHRYVVIVDAKSGDARFQEYNFTNNYAVHIFDKERYPIENDPCSQAGCQHMCANTPSGPTCLCKSNYKLKADKKTCEALITYFERSIIATNSSHICVYDVSLFTYSAPSFHCYTINGNIGPIAPAIEGTYYVTLDTSEIKFLSWNGNVTTKVAQAGLVSSLIYTWIDNILFWTDVTSGSIKMRDLSFTIATSDVLYEKLALPSHLTMDQHNRTIFWINGYPNAKKILMGNTLGNYTKVLLGSGSLSDPQDLFYDLVTHRLFFIDNGKLKSINVDGSGLYPYSSVESGKSLLIFKNYALWIDGTGNFSHRYYNFTSIKRVSTGLNSIKEIAIHDSSTMTKERGPCVIMNGGCEHICLPDNNRTVCKCHHGFHLQSDQRSCDNDPVHTDFAVVSDYLHNRIYQIPLSGTTEIGIDIPALDSPVCAVYDNITETLIWAEVTTGQIRTSDLHGNNVSVLYSLGNVSPYRFAIDSSSGNLYYTAALLGTNNSYIGVLKRTGFANKKLVLNLDAPRDIALYPSKGIMFWTDHGHTPHIGKGQMDGRSIIKIQPTKIKWPNGITIDFKDDKIYWTDGYYNEIHRSDLSGGNQELVAIDSKAWLVDVTVVGPYLYYTSWNKRIVTKMEKDTGKIVEWMSETPEFGRLDSIDIFPGETQPINKICATRNGQCSTFCFPNAQGHSCGCPDGKLLKSDGRTCEGVTLCPVEIPNGNLPTSCLGYVQEICQYSCKSGYRKRLNVDVITCGISGIWRERVDDLCEEITCSKIFNRGNISSSCDRTIGSQCSFTCFDSYTLRNQVSFLTCLSDGKWDHDIDALCTSIVEPPPENKSITAYLVAGGLVFVFFIFVIVIILLCCIKRNKNKESTSGGNGFDNSAFCSEHPVGFNENPTGNDYCSLRKSKFVEEEVYQEIIEDYTRPKSVDEEGFIDRAASMDQMTDTRGCTINTSESDATNPYLDVSYISRNSTYLEVMNPYVSNN